MLLKAVKIDKKEIIEIVKSSASESTTHGLDHFFKRENLCIRIFWIISFLISAFICCYMVTENIVSYFRYDSVTKAEEIYEASTNFPAVSICNLNPFMTNYSYEFVEQVFAESDLFNATTGLNYYLTSGQLLLKYFVGTNAQDPNRTDAFRMSLGYQMKDMLIDCLYNTNVCSTNDFDWFYDILYGNCFRFNGGKYSNGSAASIKKSTKSGSINGLRLELFLYEPESIMSLSSATGAYVTVTNQSNQAFSVIESGVQLGSGTQSNIGVQRIFSSHLEKPYSECTQDITADYPSQLVKAVLNTGYGYRQQTCFLACYERFLWQKCACYDTSAGFNISLILDNVTNVMPCVSFTQTSCNTNQYELFHTLDINSICGDECPLECDSITYNLFVSQAEYPSRTYAQALLSNPFIQSKFANLSDLTYDALKRNMIQISVYYVDLGYQQYTELEKMNAIDLISSIGGTLGLFLGMSFLSFVEIFDIFLQIFWISIKRNNSINTTK